MIHGFDVSGFQGLTAPAADFDFVKATEGSSYTSASFTAQWASAKSRAKVRGAYHFAHPEASSAASQADRLLARADAVPGEMLCLDLEVSGLGQAATNTWAREFGDRLRARAPGVTTVLYMGSGYASNGTGKGLADHFDYWWYPQYPSAYQLVARADEEALRAANRSEIPAYRAPLAAMTTLWPPAVSPWLPSGLTTGWAHPHIWQFTDNWGSSHLDASVTALTLDQLANGGHAPTPQEDDMGTRGAIPAGKGPYAPITVAGEKHIYFGWDNTYENTDLGITRQPPAEFRVAMHVGGRKGKTVPSFKVGAELTDPKGWPDNDGIALPAGCDRIDVIRLDDGDRAVGFWVG